MTDVSGIKMIADRHAADGTIFRKPIERQSAAALVQIVGATDQVDAWGLGVNMDLFFQVNLVAFTPFP